MLVEPLADVEVNVPGVMAILVAPVAAQLSLLLEPEVMLAGSAVKEVIAGSESFSGVEFDIEPQPASPAQASRIRTSRARKFSRREFSRREFSRCESSPEELSFRELR